MALQSSVQMGVGLCPDLRECSMAFEVPLLCHLLHSPSLFK